jgi:hypothetical protein
MTLVLQTHPQLSPVIRRWGCNLRCLQAIAELEADRVLAPCEIEELYTLSTAAGLIGPNCYVNDNNAVIRETAKYLGLARWPQVVSNKAARYLRIGYRVSAGTHFVLIDTTGSLYNPDPSLVPTAIEGVRYYA